MMAALEPAMPAPRITTFAGLDPRGPSQQLALAAAHPLEEVRADLRSQPPRYLAHGRQQRRAAVRGLHGLVGQAGGATLDESRGQLGVRGQVQVGEEDVPRLQPRDLLGSGSLTLTISSA